MNIKDYFPIPKNTFSKILLTDPYKWFCKGWYSYVFNNTPKGIPKLVSVLCRMRNHAGIEFYDAGGLEPDYSCKWCGEDLG